MIEKLNAGQRRDLQNQVKDAFTACSYSYWIQWVNFEENQMIIGFNDPYFGKKAGIISVEIVVHDDDDEVYPKVNLVAGEKTPGTDKLRQIVGVYVDEYVFHALDY